MIAITPIYANQKYYSMFFKWIRAHILEWKKEDIHI